MQTRRVLDRRAGFGRVAILVERDGIRITRDGAVFGGKSFAADEIHKVRLAKQAGRPSLAWLLYSAIGALTALQAMLAREPGLWAIAGAVAILACIAWRRRQSPDRFDIVVESPAGQASVLHTEDKAFAVLVHDALGAIQTRVPAA